MEPAPIDTFTVLIVGSTCPASFAIEPLGKPRCDGLAPTEPLGKPYCDDVVADVNHLCALLGNLNLDDGPRHLGEEVDVDSLFTLFGKYGSYVLNCSDPPALAGVFCPV